MSREKCGVRGAGCGVEGTSVRAFGSAIRQVLTMGVVVRENAARRTPHVVRLSIMLSLVAKRTLGLHSPPMPGAIQ